MTDQPTDPAHVEEPVDAAAYAAHLDRLDRLGREALAADPAQAIALVREANELVATLLPMHRRLMAELEHHRAGLQAACEELARSDGGPADADDGGPEDDGGEGGDRPGTPPDAAAARLARLAGVQGDDGEGDDVPF